MYKQTLQDVTYPDYPIQNLSSPSTGMEEIDILDIWESLLSSLIWNKSKKQFYSICPLYLSVDPSSIKQPHFEIKDVTSRVEELTTERERETISEEDIAIEMLEHDFVVKMSPKRRYKIQVRVESVRKGEPRLIESDEFLVTE